MLFGIDRDGNGFDLIMLAGVLGEEEDLIWVWDGFEIPLGWNSTLFYSGVVI